MFRGQHKTKSAGFSFVELTVVLASIVTIILVAIGITFMKNAKLRNVSNDISRLAQSIEKFEQEYGSLPGDIADTSALPGATGGNGNGAIDTPDEALYMWQHLSIANLIKGSYDGSSANTPGLGVPASDISGGGYKIILPKDVTVDRLGSQAIVIEFSGFSPSSNSLPIINANDAKAIDEKIDDGKPKTGMVLAEGIDFNCYNENENSYNLSKDVASCKLLFVIRPSKKVERSSDIEGECTQIGHARQVSDTSLSCPIAHEGRTIETCHLNLSGEGEWKVTEQDCIEIGCSGGGKFGERRKLSCINGMKGTIETIEKCTENGTWQLESSDCKPKENLPCETNGEIRTAQACNWGQTGYIIQECDSNRWKTTKNTCENVECNSQNVGVARTSSIGCGTRYNGIVKEVCTITGEWQITSIGTTCSPNYSGTCTPGVTDDYDIGCPPGKSGEHILTCVEANINYLTTLRDTCVPIKCSGDKNVGTARVKQGAECPDGKQGTVMEVCDETGHWMEVNNNCVNGGTVGVCELTYDMKGNAHWETTLGGQTATATSCATGYEFGESEPKRKCSIDGTWSETVQNPCVRIKCEGGLVDNGSSITDSFAQYPTAYAGDTNISGQCNETTYTGAPIIDCTMLGVWDIEKERLSCQPKELAECADEDDTMAAAAYDDSTNNYDNIPIEYIMGRPKCPSGNITNSNENWGCARMSATGTCDPNNIDDVMFYAGDVPGSTTDFFVRRCDLGQDWDRNDERCENKSGSTSIRNTYKWKNTLTTSDIWNVDMNDSITQPAAIEGIINTNSLVADGSGKHFAAIACKNLEGNWYLPAVSELDVVYAHLIGTDDPEHPLPRVSDSSEEDNIGTRGPLRNSFDVSGEYYWTSSEDDDGGDNKHSWAQRFTDGNVDDLDKTNNFNVRCARRR